jgi:hypothetical protein
MQLFLLLLHGHRHSQKRPGAQHRFKKRDAWIRFLLMRRTLPTKSTKSALSGHTEERAQGQPLTRSGRGEHGVLPDGYAKLDHMSSQRPGQ